MERASREHSRLTTAALGANIFNDPACVLDIVDYWILHYKTPGPREDALKWLPGLVDKILNGKISLTGFVQYGMIANMSTEEEWVMCISFIADCPLGLPVKYFEVGGHSEVLECIAHLIHPDNGCFMHCVPNGLRGAITMGHFQHNLELEKAYRPMTFVVACVFVLESILEEWLKLGEVTEEQANVVSATIKSALNGANSGCHDTNSLLIRMKTATAIGDHSSFMRYIEREWRDVCGDLSRRYKATMHHT